jgi:hypothetical protein
MEKKREEDVISIINRELYSPGKGRKGWKEGIHYPQGRH